MPRFLTHRAKVLHHGIVLALPPLAAALILLHRYVDNPWWRWSLAALLLVAAASSLLTLVHHSRQTYLRIANGLSAARLGPDSESEIAVPANEELEHVLHEIDGICKIFERQRSATEDARTLRIRLFEASDDALFVLDGRQRLIETNEAGAALLGASAASLLGRSARELGLEQLLANDADRYRLQLNGCDVDRFAFVEGGHRRTLLHVRRSDVDHERTGGIALQDQTEWQRLVRVLLRETSEQLTSIRALTEGIRTQIEGPLPQDWRCRFAVSLESIGRHAERLANFTDAYSGFANLPRPIPAEIEIASWIDEIADHDELKADIEGGPPLTFVGDPILLEQALRSVLADALEATTTTDGRVRVSWNADSRDLWIHVDDDGPAIPPGFDAFLPSTRRDRVRGGIGLALARVIVEAHGGTLTLVSAARSSGCRATIRLPQGRASESLRLTSELEPKASARKASQESSRPSSATTQRHLS
ncbi:MAG: PAS domain S-box protein [Planctomycetes bacterium]|nr:PAS domain S-box protein [Planctomycetota bacterium]